MCPYTEGQDELTISYLLIGTTISIAAEPTGLAARESSGTVRGRSGSAARFE